MKHDSMVVMSCPAGMHPLMVHAGMYHGVSRHLPTIQEAIAHAESDAASSQVVACLINATARGLTSWPSFANPFQHIAHRPSVCVSHMGWPA